MDNVKINGINIFESYLNVEESNCLLTKLKKSANWEQAAVGKYDNDIVSHSEIDLDFRDIEVSEIETSILGELDRKLITLKNDLSNILQISNFNFGEFMFSKYIVDSHIKPHSDTGVYSTNRLATCVLYLNDSFRGGELYFPDFDFEYKPKIGDIVTFWSEYSHGVKKLLEGERYCCVFFARSLSPTFLFS